MDMDVRWYNLNYVVTSAKHILEDLRDVSSTLSDYMAVAIVKRARSAVPVRTGRLQATIRILGFANPPDFDDVRFQTQRGLNVNFQARHTPKRYVVAVGGIRAAGTVKQIGVVKHVNYAPIVEMRTGWFGKVLRAAVPAARRAARTRMVLAIERFAAGSTYDVGTSYGYNEY